MLAFALKLTKCTDNGDNIDRKDNIDSEDYIDNVDKKFKIQKPLI
jgi:hypothetical protein